MADIPPMLRLPMLLLGLLALVIGVFAGLARLMVDVPAIAAAQAGMHGALMIAGFLGTVISLERAVALARIWSYLAPLCAGLGGLMLALGLPPVVAQALFIVAGAIALAGNGVILRRHPGIHHAMLALGSGAWLIGNLAWLIGGAIIPAVPWWMAFLVFTITGERLELTRFLPKTPGARALFVAIVAMQLFGLAIVFWQGELGLRLFAAALLAMALWRLRHDSARRTVRQEGLPRYIAVCLLAGYGWLAVGGLLGMGGSFALGNPLRDAALHSIFLGFVISMIFGHAPIILPALARIRIPYHTAFYLPLMVLHMSLLARVIGDFSGTLTLSRWAGIANATALLLFIITMLVSVFRGLRRTGAAADLETGEAGSPT